jgi:hypothetical protein
MEFERHTKAEIKPAITIRQLYEGILEPAEFRACFRLEHILKVKGHIVAEGPNTIEMVSSCIREECFENGEARTLEKTKFLSGDARSKVLRAFGLSHIGIIGTTNHITAILVSSYITAISPEVHVKKFAAILRAIKRKFPIIHFGVPTCQTTLACDPALTHLLESLLTKNDFKP